MPENPLNFFEISHKPLREQVLELARAGISHVDLSKVLKGEVYKGDVAHDFPHTMRVLKTAEALADATGSDKGVVIPAVAFHDLITRPKNDPMSSVEAHQSAEYAEDILKTLGYSPKAILDIKTAIRTSAFVEGFSPETPEAKILYDADKLDQFGAIGIMRYFASGGKGNRPFFNSEDPFAETERKREEHGYTLDALIDRVPRVGKSLTTEPAKRIASRRWKFFKTFLEELAIELEESGKNTEERWARESGAFAIMQIFDKAGKDAQTFYHVDDPFASSRYLESSVYPIDTLISLKLSLEKNNYLKAPQEIYERRLEFLNNFLVELNKELSGEGVVYPETEHLPHNADLGQ